MFRRTGRRRTILQYEHRAQNDTGRRAEDNYKARVLNIRPFCLRPTRSYTRLCLEWSSDLSCYDRKSPASSRIVLRNMLETCCLKEIPLVTWLEAHPKSSSTTACGANIFHRCRICRQCCLSCVQRDIDRPSGTELREIQSLTDPFIAACTRLLPSLPYARIDKLFPGHIAAQTPRAAACAAPTGRHARLHLERLLLPFTSINRQ